MRFQPIYDIAQLCSAKGIKDVVVCPGSRSAPLVLGFTRHPDIQCRVISDERSAGFIAIGMAQASQETIALISTSGTAAFNFAPAIAEAFYQNTPLVVFTADRPKEYIDQKDGQTIHQTNIFGHHVKKSFELPQEYEHEDSKWHINRLVNEAINIACEFPAGPVHINAPFREPLYSEGGNFQYTKNIRVIKKSRKNFTSGIPTEDLAKLAKHKKILVVCGQQQRDNKLLNALDHFSKVYSLPVVGDITSNIHTLSNAILHGDSFLAECGESVKESLKPDLLITLGNSVLSKNLKQFLRKYRAIEHWHLQESGYVADTFQQLSTHISVHPVVFFEAFNVKIESTDFDHQKRENYLRLWEAEENRTKKSMERFFTQENTSHFHLTKRILLNLPGPCSLHLANSMSVRYANFVGLSADHKDVEVFCNRGTSGIDGCISTCMGHGFKKNHLHILLTGDMALFYDRNAFWHSYAYPNLRIVLLNDHGGGIF
ncbi:MAG: 2-succinyl-5-enolpyruvyl-6-hydroxy-3-cyclohexene-1-carboxylic-acid synthase [Flammeovirgaceae bacterium]|nr:2-succinyl-5-enolpyruvyl-6-hydroxy-3-cyclohexene-1-carboxylic-acid synthase [Flammeovirgaceae bacterium]